MSRIRSDSIWNSLAPERRKIFEGWLFDERIGYQDAAERAQKEWGVTGSKMSVGRFYKRVQMERVVDELENAADAATGVNAAEGKLESLRSSAMKVIGMQLLDKAMERGDVKDLATLGRVLTQSEEREIQRGRLALARERFQFKATKAALKLMPLLNQMKQEDQEREDTRMDEICLAIFGDDPNDPPSVTPGNA
jgi:hypothetical protein